MHLRSARRVAALLLIAALAALGLVPAALASVPAKVTSSALVYQSASPNAARVRVPQGLQVNITAVKGGCAQVSYKGHVGYMSMGNLAPAAKVRGYATCSAGVYSASGSRMCTVSKGTGVYVLGTIGSGYLVMNGSGALGLMKSGTLSSQKPKTNANKQPNHSYTPLERVLIVARSLLGRKYSADSNPPSSFNCSSFVQYCMAAGGCSMKGTAAEQATDGRYALIGSLSSVRAGDVLCFDTTGNGIVDHTAIYLGDNKFVEASKNAGKVQVNTLTSWYEAHFKWARRPS